MADSGKVRVLVGMSGGIDSTAACMMLSEQGYEVVGLTIINHSAGMTEEGGRPAYVDDAASAASFLRIEHHIADERACFERDVCAPFVRKWMAGLTPNPCVECNPAFKFRLLCFWADRLECPLIATGHYARITNIDGRNYVSCAEDSGKDQSYFLWKLEQNVLGRTLFPIGGFRKTEIRRYLAEKGYGPGPSKRESMEICFIENDYREYLREKMPDVDEKVGPGAYVDSMGRIIGTHSGYPFYTVGQRKGLGVAFGTPRYVLRTNAEKNTVMLGTADQLTALYMIVRNAVFTPEMRDDGLTVKIRYRSAALPCCIQRVLDDGRIIVRFLTPASAVTPGQYAVFYRNSTVVGGAEIDSQKGLGQYVECNGDSDSL